MYEKYVARSLMAAGKNAKETGKEREIKIIEGGANYFQIFIFGSCGMLISC